MGEILVTGGAGFIGSHFVDLWLELYPTDRVVVLDKLTYAGSLENLREAQRSLRLKFQRGDIADRDLLERLFRETRFDLVVNFAAETHVDRSIMDASPFLHTNVLGTQALLEAIRTFGAGRFLQVSTDEVYGPIPEGRASETAPLRPRSPYAASKAAADLLVRAYRETYGLPVLIVRPTNTYGPRQFPEKLIPLALRSALLGQPIPVYGDGRQVRDWLYVADAVRAIALVAAHGTLGEVYNIAGRSEMENLALLDLLLEILGEETGRDPADYRRLITFVKDRPGHDRRYGVDDRKLREELGWCPYIPLREGLRRTIRWYLRNPQIFERSLSGESGEFQRRWYRTRGHPFG